MSAIETNEEYYGSLHRFGRWTTLAAVGLMFSVPIVTSLVYRISVDYGSMFTAAVSLCLVFIPTQLTEVISFAPILGSGGTYLAFVTGNVMNMKLPAAASGHRLAEVEPHSDQGEVVSVLAIGMSSVTTTLIIFAGMFMLTPFIHYLRNPALQPAFNNIMPALMATMLVPTLKKDFRLGIVPCILAVLAGILIPGRRYGMLQGYLLVGTMAASIIAAYFITRQKDAGAAAE